eukprot:gb/GECG01012546.1/.p1 GENE.gb/GECG01012546.1/~~gb/GECG01012546.1/.p1  ORF type:complete len:296 (+),score=22.66 gb/GECG01012546.1/:1-888(+)
MMDEMPTNRKHDIASLWRHHKFNVISYSLLGLAVLCVWHFESDQDFSFLMTLGSALTTFAFIVLALRTRSRRKATGISLKMLQAYACVFGGRLCSILIFEGYLPYDRSGDWFYRATEVISFATVVYLIMYIASTLGQWKSDSYNVNVDRFGYFPPYVPNKFGVVWLVVPAYVLALLFHPSLNSNFFTDTAWAFSLYLEAVAIIPQLYLFQKKGGVIDELLGNSIFALGLARLLHLSFWLLSYSELNDSTSQTFLSAYPGYMVMLSQIAQLVLMGNYFRMYLTAAKRGEALSVLPV